MFAIVRRVSNAYPIEFKVMTPTLVAWMDNGRCTEPTHQELVERLKGVDMTATAKGGKGNEAALVGSATGSPIVQQGRGIST